MTPQTLTPAVARRDSTAKNRVALVRPKKPLRWITTAAVAAAVVGLHAVAIEGTDFKPELLVDGWKGMAAFIGDAFPPDLSWEKTLKPGLEATLVTLWIGLLGTTLSVPFALLLAALAAENTSPHRLVYQGARAVLSFFRAVPDIVFALIFVTAVGLGPFAGVLALICHNTGVMGKLWAESMEEIDAGPQEALRTAGANRIQQVANATLPMVVPQFVGLLLYRFDVNVRSSLVLGLVGAGGIGLLINQSIKSFQFDSMLTHILIVLVLIIVVDQFSAWIRRRLAA
ncbi:phosphonate ABC transporter, permease protein PhnE [Arthrobacter sp. AK01]|uniref:phosphonate ABC transporter, permease protein PhnE n=1 Tax=Micrococcaceae TaxID=1268 RepID=UPI001E3202A4|nr:MULTISPECIES: phosphonate ABC transporter, permease protein PhnE [Micrococcaceae]MCD4852062.1 phosphonate ABC transporter, permease protein PhnE [Arthrobacter sp. AK01]MCP1412953.1 phosphonate transport system permease protein [Paenarthrobacter sp. A20]